MDSLPKLDTQAESDSTRYSYASSTDLYPRSARSSYVSISNASATSSRTSYSYIPESLRVSSFSRTSDSFLPDDSLSSTPASSRDSSPDSLTRWTSKDSVVMADQTVPLVTSTKRPRSHTRSGSNDGPSALKELENVQNIICVAFGAFDRYYISWEDKEGDFHQESHKLPESLYRWLFPPSGETRHLPTLQVSFGSNDEFFASDQFGKLSNRDASPHAGERKPAPRLAEITRGMMRKKSYTISTPTLPADVNDLERRSDMKGNRSKMPRRRTFMDEGPSFRPDSKQSITPLAEHQLRRLESRSEMPKVKEDNSILLHTSRPDMKQVIPVVEGRRSILVANPPGRPTWLERTSVSMTKDRIQSQPVKAMAQANSRYVDAGVQTDIRADEVCAPLRSISVPTIVPQACLPPRHTLSIGSMSEFCRSQYRLGDALRYV